MAFHDQRLGENLRRIRLNAHITQRVLSEQIGYQTPEHWSRVESGRRRSPLHMLDRFCELLNVSYEEVLRGATEARIRSDAEHERAGSYEEKFAAIIADCPPDVVEGILSVCEQIAHLPGLRK